ncbi:MAG: class II aldolase/adducin family protein [Clostridiales bacterium]|nr:class II aldolase/adducin family protein [Clostridiales bacterium]
MSDNSRIIRSIISAASRLSAQGLAVNLSVCARSDAGFFMTAPSADFSAPSENDVFPVPLSGGGAEGGKETKIFETVFAAKKKINAAILASPPYLTRLSELGAEIPPILDDFAQIIGSSMKTAAAQKILSALKGRNGCMIENLGALVLGRTADEAATALLVAEKTAKTYVLAQYIGTPAPISLFETKLMNFVYKVKYSKKAVNPNEK